MLQKVLMVQQLKKKKNAPATVLDKRDKSRIPCLQVISILSLSSLYHS